MRIPLSSSIAVFLVHWSWGEAREGRRAYRSYHLSARCARRILAFPRFLRTNSTSSTEHQQDYSANKLRAFFAPDHRKNCHNLFAPSCCSSSASSTPPRTPPPFSERDSPCLAAGPKLDCPMLIPPHARRLAAARLQQLVGHEMGIPRGTVECTISTVRAQGISWGVWARDPRYKTQHHELSI